MPPEPINAKEDAQSLREEGNAKFKSGDFREAIETYSRSLELDPQQHLCFSNRSAAYLKLGDSAEAALRDAESCVALAPTWTKGYSRLAAALQELKQWDQAIEVCERGLAVAKAGAQLPDEPLQKMLAEVHTRRFQHQLQGTWHGKVSDTLGGYEQEMEFLDCENVRVQVLGRSIVGKFWVDAAKDPQHLNIQVPMHDMPPGMPPPPPVPYIARIDDAGLHICCPFMRMERPVAFEGPGYCLMVAGSSTSLDEASILDNLSPQELRVQCARELTGALPNSRLEEVSQFDSEDVARDKLMAQVKFESSMFSVQKRFGDDLLKEVLDTARGESSGNGEVCGPEFQALREKLQVCGILDKNAHPAGNPDRPAAASSKTADRGPDAQASQGALPPASGAHGTASQQAVAEAVAEGATPQESPESLQEWQGDTGQASQHALVDKSGPVQPGNSGGQEKVATTFCTPLSTPVVISILAAAACCLILLQRSQR